MRLQVQNVDRPLYRGTYHCFQSIIRQESVRCIFLFLRMQLHTSCVMSNEWLSQCAKYSAAVKEGHFNVAGFTLSTCSSQHVPTWGVRGWEVCLWARASEDLILRGLNKALGRHAIWAEWRVWSPSFLQGLLRCIPPTPQYEYVIVVPGLLVPRNIICQQSFSSIHNSMFLIWRFVLTSLQKVLSSNDTSLWAACCG